MEDVDFSNLYGWLIIGVVVIVVVLLMVSAARRNRGLSANYDFPRQCGACGKACPAAAKFCSQCGRQLEIHHD